MKKSNKLDIKFTYSLFILFSLIIFACAQTQTQSQQTWQQYVPNWFPLFAVAIGIGFGITGLAFMLARTFQLPQMETWARAELFEVTGSAFLVLIILITLGVIDNLFIATLGMKPTDLSLDFTNRISERLMDRYIDSVKLGAAVGMLSGPPVQYLGATSSTSDKSGQINQGSGTQATGGNDGKPVQSSETPNRIWMVAIKSFKMNYLTFYAADVFNGHFNLVQSITLTSLAISIFSHILLNFINSIAIPFLIPFGLFLSIFAFTRKMGRTIIAFGVGLYLFVPLSIIIAQTMYDSAFKPNSSIPAISRPSGNSNIDRFTTEVFAYEALDLLSQLAIAQYAILSNGDKSLLPSCATGAVSLSSICGIAAPACAPVFTMICSMLGGMSDVGSGLDNINTIQNVLSVLRVASLSMILDVPISDQLASASATIVSLGIAGVASTFIFHLIPSNVITINYIMPVLQQLMNFGQYEVSVLTASLYANMNQYLAIKLTNIALAYTPYVMQDAVPVLLIPFIIIFTVITGIRSISPAIGGEVQILGVSELI
ncbi:MAG: hypothetical protein QXO35_02585 [Candidatus Micrarchaeia archaeon]